MADSPAQRSDLPFRASVERVSISFGQPHTRVQAREEPSVLDAVPYGMQAGETQPAAGWPLRLSVALLCSIIACACVVALREQVRSLDEAPGSSATAQLEVAP